MLDFLKEYNISEDVIKRMKQENSKANIYNFSCNRDEVIKMINYFKELSINTISDLLIYRIELFFNTLEDIQERFSKYDINYLVEQINNDFMIIDEIN